MNMGYKPEEYFEPFHTRPKVCPTAEELAEAFWEAQQETVKWEYKQPWSQILEHSKRQMVRWCEVAIARAQEKANDRQ